MLSPSVPECQCLLNESFTCICFLQLTSRDALNHLALGGPEGLAFLGMQSPMGLCQQFLAGYQHQALYSEKEAGFKFGTHCLCSCSEGTYTIDVILVIFLCLLLAYWCIPKKGNYTLIWSPNICNCCPGNTSILPGSGGQQGLCFWHLRTIYIVIYF